MEIRIGSFGVVLRRLRVERRANWQLVDRARDFEAPLHFDALAIVEAVWFEEIEVNFRAFELLLQRELESQGRKSDEFSIFIRQRYRASSHKPVNKKKFSNRLPVPRLCIVNIYLNVPHKKV